MKRNRLRPSLQTFRHKTHLLKGGVYPYFFFLGPSLSLLDRLIFPSVNPRPVPCRVSRSRISAIGFFTVSDCSSLSLVVRHHFRLDLHIARRTTMAGSVDAATRKRVLKVVFISLTLDLVSRVPVACLPRDPSADTSPPRYPSPSSSLCSPSSSNSTATLKPQPTRTPLPRIPSCHGSSASSMPTRPPLRAPSTLAMILYCSAAPSARCSPCSRLSRRPSSEHYLTNMAGATHCWPA